MTRRRAATVVGCALVVAAAVMLVRPQRFAVDGLSMAPGLMPGDVVATGWLPVADRLRPPRRFERWVVVPPDGAAAVKRVAGLPGEEVAIRDGDLVVDGTSVLKGPAVLAGMALLLAIPLDVQDGRAMLPAGEVLDDVDFAREVNRPLEPVRDVGLVALLETGTGTARVRLTFKAATLTWRLPAATRVRLIGGRLDGHLVAVAWRDVPGDRPPDSHSGLAVRAPDAWSFTAACPIDQTTVVPPRCDLEIDGDGWIERVAAWRDVHLRPAADGRTSWRLDAASSLVLGDFPTGSLDSRHWGPLPRASLRHPVARTPRVRRPP